MPLFPLLSRVTLGFIDAQESAELLCCVGVDAEIEPRHRPCRFVGRGALLWSIYPRADIKTIGGT